MPVESILERREGSRCVPFRVPARPWMLEIWMEMNERRGYLLLCMDEVEIVWMYAILIPSAARGGPSAAMRKSPQRVKMACEVRTWKTQLA